MIEIYLSNAPDTVASLSPRHVDIRSRGQGAVSNTKGDWSSGPYKSNWTVRARSRWRSSIYSS